MTRSMVGCSAQMAVDAAPDEVGARTHQRKPRVNLPLPRRGEGVPPHMCLRCGIPGKHPTAAACIDALRDRLSRWE
jgi:hypothetical protein